MAEHGWPPDVIGRLTVAQLMCLSDKSPPDAAKAIDSLDDYTAAVAEANRLRQVWAE